MIKYRAGCHTCRTHAINFTHRLRLKCETGPKTFQEEKIEIEFSEKSPNFCRNHFYSWSDQRRSEKSEVEKGVSKTKAHFLLLVQFPPPCVLFSFFFFFTSTALGRKLGALSGAGIAKKNSVSSGFLI